MLVCPLVGHAEEARKVSCRFVGCAGTRPPSPLINTFEKGLEVSCTIPVNTFSEPVVCLAKANVITFVSADDRKPLASASIPEHVKAAILVFVPVPTPTDLVTWRVHVIEDTTKNFPDGGAFIANFYKQDVRCVLGTSTLILKSGTDHGFARPEKRDAFNMAPVIFQFQQNDAWRTTSETLLRFVPGMRYLIYSYLDPASGRPRIATFQDFMPVAPTPPPRR
ncbi:MAG: hypothetical protein DVB25_05365 [Verrucomicrobia bacterium]|nr:MAG: hypothetical protein DVB25_05365 [Verrucomicrobiota bacterium]